jgi:hypothetical protein
MSKKIDAIDPFGFWQTMKENNLEIWSKVIIELMNNEAYRKATAIMLNNYLTASIPFRQTLENAVEQTLSSLNIPNQKDFISVAERLVNIEIKLDKITSDLELIKKSTQTKKQHNTKNKITINKNKTAANKIANTPEKPNQHTQINEISEISQVAINS